MHNMRPGVLPDAAVQGLLLSLDHSRQAGVREALHYDTLHESAAIVVFDVANPLQAHVYRLRQSARQMCLLQAQYYNTMM